MTFEKIYNKSKAFHKHGKHKGMHGELVKRNRKIEKEDKEEKYDSVSELFHQKVKRNERLFL